MATIVCQLSCLSSINRRFKLHKLSILNRNNNNNKNSLTLGTSFANTLKYTAVSPVSHVEATKKNPFPIEENSTKKIIDENSSYGYGEGEGAASPTEATRKYPYPIEEYYMGATKKIIEENPSYREGEGVVAPVKATKGTSGIPDYFFGFPYGLLVLSGGLLGFILSRDLSNLTFTYGMLVGFAILSLSKASELACRLGISCLPFTLGQAVLSALLLLKDMQNYLLTRALLPTTVVLPALNIAISAAMVFFYLNNIISGGNPPHDNRHDNRPSVVITLSQRDNKGRTTKKKKYFF